MRHTAHVEAYAASCRTNHKSNPGDWNRDSRKRTQNMVVVLSRNRCVTLSAPNAVQLTKEPQHSSLFIVVINVYLSNFSYIAELHALGHFCDYVILMGRSGLQHIRFTCDNYAFIGSSITFQGHPNE